MKYLNNFKVNETNDEADKAIINDLNEICLELRDIRFTTHVEHNQSTGSYIIVLSEYYFSHENRRNMNDKNSQIEQETIKEVISHIIRYMGIKGYSLNETYLKKVNGGKTISKILTFKRS